MPSWRRFCRGGRRPGYSHDGPGFAPQQLAALGQASRSVKGAGHGLGLWIVYQITRQLGGEIHVESEPGSTSFSIEIPYGNHGNHGNHGNT